MKVRVMRRKLYLPGDVVAPRVRLVRPVGATKLEDAIGWVMRWGPGMWRPFLRHKSGDDWSPIHHAYCTELSMEISYANAGHAVMVAHLKRERGEA